MLSYLRGYVYNPRGAVNEVEEWMIRLRAEWKEHKLELEREVEKQREEHQVKLKRAKARKADEEQARLRALARQSQQVTYENQKLNGGRYVMGGENGSGPSWPIW